MSEQNPQDLKNNMHAMLADKLRQAEYKIGVSEIHGVLCGLACQGINEDKISDYSALVQLNDNDGKLIVEGLYSLILRDLQSDDSSFKLLLPDDDEQLTSRIEGTADWANGFLQGILHNNEKLFNESSPTTRECLQDLLEISQMDSDLSDLGDDDKVLNESASQLTEIEEYLRVNVQLMFIEQKKNPTQPVSTSQH